MQRRTLVRARDLSSFRDALAERALAGVSLAARRRAVIVPTRASAELFRQTLEGRALDAPGRALILPDLLTRDDWMARLQSAVPDAPPLLPRLARERLLDRAARAAGRRARMRGSPFELRPGLVAAMLDLFDELKRRQRTVSRFAQVLFDELRSERDTDRGSESLVHQTAFLGFTFLGYERAVAESGGWDEHLLRRRLLDRPFALPYDHVVVAVADHPSDPKGLWPADFDLLGRLAGLSTIDVVVTDEVHDAGYRERVEQELPGIEEVRHDGPPARPVVVRPPGDPESLSWKARDREEELRDVARLIRARARTGPSGPELGGPTAVVFRRPLPYLYLAQQVLADAQVPYQAFDALPLAAEPYAGLVDLVVSAARTGGTRETSVALLRSTMLTFDQAGEPVRLADAAALDAALADRRAGGEADTYTAVVDDYFEDPETRRKDQHGAARRAARAAAAIRDELAPYRSGPTAIRIRAIAAFLRRHERPIAAGAPVLDRHLRARAAILAILDALAAAFDEDGDAPDGGEDPTAWIRHAIEAQTFAPRRGTAGVHLADAVAARFGEFDHVHLVGLVETDWPARAARSIFYTSGLLEPLGWAAGRAHAKAELAAFRDLLTLARETTTLHAFDLEGDAIVARSSMLDLARDLPAVDAPARGRSLVFADEILTSGVRPDGLDPGVGSWLELRRARPGLDDLRYRGHVDPRPAQAYRVTGVERYTLCAFKYFAESVLRLPEEREESESLTPLERGLFVHTLLEQFYRAWQDRGGRAITEATLPEAQALFEGLARASLARLSPGDRALEEARLLGSLVSPGLADRVFNVEIDSPGDVVERLIETRLEGAFVFPQLAGLKQRTIEIRGKADRVDVFADGSFRVIDYKNGKAPNKDTSLQIAVYAHVMKAMLESRDGRPHGIREAMYLAFGDADSFKNALRGTPTADAVVGARAAIFADTVDLIETGKYPARPADLSSCEYCAFAGFCRKEYLREGDGPAELV
jgi:RecB family exonuclease